MCGGWGWGVSVGEQTEDELTAVSGMCPFSHLAATTPAQLLREASPDWPSAQPSLYWPLCPAPGTARVGLACPLTPVSPTWSQLLLRTRALGRSPGSVRGDWRTAGTRSKQGRVSEYRDKLIGPGP